MKIASIYIIVVQYYTSHNYNILKQGVYIFMNLNAVKGAKLIWSILKTKGVVRVQHKEGRSELIIWLIEVVKFLINFIS